MGIQGRLKNLQSSREITKEDIQWLKDNFNDIDDKFNQIKDWKDLAVAKFEEIDGLLEQARTKLIDHEQRIRELENAG